MNDPTVWRTSVCGCPACLDRRIHTSTDLAAHHPYSGHGYDRMHWSHPALDPKTLKTLQDGSSASVGVGVNWPTGKVTHE